MLAMVAWCLGSDLSGARNVLGQRGKEARQGYGGTGEAKGARMGAGAGARREGGEAEGRAGRYGRGRGALA